MKAPEYIAVKDFPGFKKGELLIKMENSEFYGNKSWMPTIMIAHELIKQSPDYFKLVEEKEYTASDMVAYSNWRLLHLEKRIGADTLQHWKDYLASKTDAEYENS